MATALSNHEISSGELATNTVNGIYWEGNADLLVELADFSDELVSDWLANGTAELIKKGPHRAVYKVDLRFGTVYIKHNLVPDLRTSVRQFLRPCKAKMEYQKNREILDRGIPSIEPLAWGKRLTGTAYGESFYITRALSDTCQFDLFLEQCLTKPIDTYDTLRRSQICTELGKFVARIHCAGVTHKDLHCGNILIRHTFKNTTPEFFLVDLQSTSLGRPLNWHQKKNNLVMLNRWLSLRASKTDRLRFWKAYSSYCQNADEQWMPGKFRNAHNSTGIHYYLRQMAREIESATVDSNRGFWKRRDRRCFESNRHNKKIKANGNIGFTVTSVNSQVANAFVSNPEDFLRQFEKKILKDSKSAKVVEGQQLILGQDRQLVLKKFIAQKWYDGIINYVRPSQAWRSWMYGHGFLERALPTARPLVFVQSKLTGKNCASYLLMEKIEADRDIFQACQFLAGLPGRKQNWLLQFFVGEMARLLLSLHQRGLVHRDLKAPNILFVISLKSLESMSLQACQDFLHSRRSSRRSSFVFIDLVGVSRPFHISDDIRRKNLARLNTSFRNSPLISNTMRLRFLLTYLQAHLKGRGGWKKWWRAIDAFTQEKIQKNQKRNRPLH